MHHLILATLLAAGCADPYGDAKKADTVEAWEKYLATSPSGSRLLGAQDRLEELMIAKARASKALADYDAVFKRFPNSRSKKALQEERTKIHLAQAESENTSEAWEGFVKQNPWVDGTTVKNAQNRLAVAAYMPFLTITTPTVEPANLANDPKGPKDGWAFGVNVTNNGEKIITQMNLIAVMLDAEGASLRATTWDPLVGAKYSTGQYTPQEIADPLKPGQSRVWNYTTGDVPEGWNHTIKVVPSKIAFEGG